MRKWAWGLLLLPFVWWLTQAQPVQAASLPQKPQAHYYVDELNVLDAKSQQLIDTKNQTYQATKQQPQIGVAVVKSTHGEALGQYAPDLFAKWGIGSKSRDNGVLIVFAKNGGKNNMRIEVGYGLEGELTDALAGRILDKHLSQIKSADTAKQNQAVQSVFNAVATVIDRRYKFPKDDNTVSMTQYAQKRRTTSDDSGWFGAIVKIIVAVVVVIIIIASIGGGGGRGGRRRGESNWWLWWLLGSLLSGGRGGRGGGFGGGGGSSWGGGSSGGGGADV